MAKMLTIKPITDIIYDGINHRAGSEPFEVPEDIAKSLIDGKKATGIKK